MPTPSPAAITAIDAAIAQEFGGQVSAAPYRTLSIRDLWKRPGLDWLIDGVIHAGTCCVVYGASRSGKSFLGRDMALAIAHGRP